VLTHGSRQRRSWLIFNVGQKMKPSIQQFEALGAGLFIRTRNVESRVSEKDFHRAFSKPVIVWITPGDYQEDGMDSVLDVAKKLHAIQCFRFPNVRVSSHVLSRIRSEFPKARVEGVKKKAPNKAPEPTRGSGRDFE
jgi:hypothetical protein